MSRVKRSAISKSRKKKLFKLTKGYRGPRKNLLRLATETLNRALNYAYRDRRTKKRDFRRLWITRIGAAAKLNNVSYSKLTGALKKKSIELDRKILADIAVHDPKGFEEIVKVAVDA
jgi:large subunit ribosomal protein L20